MEGNDLSSSAMPTIIVVFEGLLAHPPKNRQRKVLVAPRRAGKATSIINSFDVDITVEAALWNLWHKRGVDIEVVTYMDDAFVPHIEKLFQRRHFPARQVWATDPQTLARDLARMPWVVSVYDGEPSRQFTYGHWGRIVTPDLRAQIGIF